jgi:ActR/RegA family two-component response regulator
MAGSTEARAVHGDASPAPCLYRSVLIADASVRDREQLAREFHGLGLTTLVADDPRRLPTRPLVVPDLVVLDDDPVNQEEAVRGLRRSFPGARLVVLTAFPSLQASFEAGRAGVGAYLLKPMRAPEILRAIGAGSTALVGALPSLERQRREYIEWVLALHHGNKTQTARALGIPRYSLQRIRARFPPAR